MARPRRKAPARSGRRWLPIAAVLAVLIVAGLIIAGIVILNQQIKGYFTGGPAGRHAAQAPGASPSVGAAAETPSPGVTPSPGASPTKPGLQVAIIIDDCGYSEKRCTQFLQLPIPITLSILPLTPYGKQIEADALAAGKSVMLHLPMEPESAHWRPGNGAITTEMTDDQVRAQVEADVDFLSGVPGANNHMGSKATSDPRVMRDVLDVLRERHMFFIDSMTSQQTVGETIAREISVPTAERDVFLDNSKDLDYIIGQLKEAERVAKQRGSAIAIGHPNDSTAQALAQTVPEMEAAGVTFVPAASLVR